MTAEPLYPRSDHCDGERFFNPGVETDKSFRDLWRWRRQGSRVAWPAKIENPIVPPPPASARAGETVLTFIGQASVLIQVEGCNILTDPIFSERASPVAFAGPRRARPPGVAFRDLPRIDLVLLSHNHYDHMDLPSLRALRERDAPVVLTGLGNGRALARAGMPDAIELDWWQACRPSRALEVCFTPAQHWSSRTLFDRRRVLWGGFAIHAEASRVFFAGDSGYGPHFARIGETLRPEVALLPIGAYEPRWFMATQHMDPADAVKAHRDLGASLSLGTHWGTFQLTDEAHDAPLQALAAARAAEGLPDASFQAPEPGVGLVWRRHGLTAETPATPSAAAV